MNAITDNKPATAPVKHRRRLPTELSIFLVLIGIGLVFEVFGWIVRDQSFLMNSQRLVLMILQVSIIGLLAIGVTQVIITTGIDLSSGSVLALSAMIAASLAQTSDFSRAVFPSLTDLPVWIPVAMGLGVGLLAGAINGSIIAVTGIPPFIATLGMMVSARGLARYYTEGQPVSMLSDSYTAIGHGAMPVIIFLVVAVIFHIALRYTKYGKYTYAIGGNMQAARTSGINVKRHLIIVYSIAGLLAGLACNTTRMTNPCCAWNRKRNSRRCTTPPWSAGMSCCWKSSRPRITRPLTPTCSTAASSACTTWASTRRGGRSRRSRPRTGSSLTH